MKEEEIENCPICNSILIFTDNYDVDYTELHSCKNGCYSRVDSIEFCLEKIFEQTFDQDAENSHEWNQTIENRKQMKIDYWKENDRYLAKILEGRE